MGKSGQFSEDLALPMERVIAQERLDVVQLAAVIPHVQRHELAALETSGLTIFGLNGFFELSR